MQQDAFKEIAERQIAYFGGPGKMLLPSPATVAAFIKKIPKGKLVTTDVLRKLLAQQCGVQGTCPVTTRIALREIAQQRNVPFWRVLKQNGELLKEFPGGVQAQYLKDEGFVLEDRAKAVRVKNFRQYLLT